jgi:hypothetical protein
MFLLLCIYAMNSTRVVQTEQIHEHEKHTTHVRLPVRSKGKIQIFVRSSRTLVLADTVGYPSFVPVALLSLSPRSVGAKRVLVYEKQLDPEQKKFLDEAAGLAERLGMDLDVKDLGKQNIFLRFLSRVASGSVATPSIVIPGRSFEEIEHGLAWQGVTPISNEQTSKSSSSGSSFSNCSRTVGA